MTNNNEKKNNSALDTKLKAILNDTAWQRGLTWRNQKVNAVAEARRRGISEEEIFKQLKRAGLIDATAKAIMNDAFYLEDSEIPAEPTPEPEQVKCGQCGNDITEQVNSGQEYFQFQGLKFCNKICYDRFMKKREKEDKPHG